MCCPMGASPSVISRSRRRRRDGSRSLRVVRVIAAGLLAAYGLSLLASALGATGYLALLAGAGKLLFIAGLVGLLVTRAVLSPEDRAAWFCFAMGLTAYLAGALAYEWHYRYLNEVPHPSWSDAGFMTFYPLAYVALILLLR